MNNFKRVVASILCACQIISVSTSVSAQGLQVGKAPEIRGVQNIVCEVGTQPKLWSMLRGIDVEDGDITTKIEIISDVDYNQMGTYIENFKITDSDGNTTIEERIVTVAPTGKSRNNKPIIEFTNDLTLNVGDVFDPMSDITAIDFEDGDISNSVWCEVMTLVDTKNPGTQTLTYTVTDNDGEMTTVERVIIIEEKKIDLADNDEDGIKNDIEKLLELDANSCDTDGDGLSDGDELIFSLTDPLMIDSDNNGVLDGGEDVDNDGLSNLYELEISTNIINNDSDGDTIFDGDEVENGTNPLKADSDNDGLSDSDEYKYNLNPLIEDSLGDGILDGNRTFDIVLEVSDEKSEDTVKIDVLVNATAADINNSKVSKVSENSVFLSDRVPGYIGNAFDIEVPDGMTADISFEIDDSILKNAEIIPAVYFWNEEIQFLEKVENQQRSRATIDIIIRNSNPGKYIVLDSKIYDAVWATKLLLPDTDTEVKDIDIVFSIDSSGSMSSNDTHNIRLSETRKFIDMLSENDRGAIVDFDSSAVTYQSLTSDKELLKTVVGRIDSSGGTDIYSGLHEALRQFDFVAQGRNVNESFYSENLVTSETDIIFDERDIEIEDNVLSNNENVIMPISDMPENGDEETNNTRKANRYIFLLTDGDGGYGNYNTLVNDAISKQVTIYTVGLGNGVNSNMLKTIAEATGGVYIHANNAEELNVIFTGISDDITDFSKDSDKDGINDYYEKKMDAGLYYI